VDEMDAVFSSGEPTFGSCFTLQFITLQYIEVIYSGLSKNC